MRQWYEPLFGVLAELAPETTRVTVTFGGGGALAGARIPDAADAHVSWLR